jgi:hypothetical protein
MMLYLTFAVFLALGVLAFLGARWASQREPSLDAM